MPEIFYKSTFNWTSSETSGDDGTAAIDLLKALVADRPGLMAGPDRKMIADLIMREDGTTTLSVKVVSREPAKKVREYSREREALIVWSCVAVIAIAFLVVAYLAA